MIREKKSIYNVEILVHKRLLGEKDDMSTFSKHFLLTDTTIIKGTEEPPIHNATIEIRNGKIIDIKKETTAEIEKETVVINLSGMTVLPGLIDMHAHLVTRFDAIRKLLLAHGVTTVREVETNLRSLIDFRWKTRAKEIVGPRVFSTGPFFESTPTKGCLKVGFITEPRIIDNADFAGLEVEKAKKAGVDVIEVHFNIDEKVMRAMISSANDLGIPTVGDFLFSRKVFASHAVDAGIKALDHASGIAQLFCDNIDKVQFFEEWASVNMEKALAFADDLAKTGTFLIPTLVWFEAQSMLAEHSVNNAPLFKLLPKQIRKRWVNPKPLFGVEKWMKGAKATFENLKKFLAVFARHRGKVVTGTDTPNYFVFPGTSMHKEIELLVASGLTPIQAIQAATRNPAELLNATNIGTIEKGKLADLLIVEGDPLRDIKAIRNTKIVIKDGEVYYPEKVLKSIEKSPFDRVLSRFRIR